MTTSRSGASLNDLLEHADWVRGLAYQLVQDAARADDLVQEAWITAMESPPRHASNLRAWLGSVVTHLASSERRAERRRSTRERLGSRQEAQPPTDQLVHEAQLSSELVEAVAAMDEPYKTVLLLRYFRDEKPSAIARELGRPLATVKTQLQRGLERLRVQLDERYGDRRSWCLALLPLTKGGSPGLALISLWPLAGVAALLLAGAVLWNARNDDRNPEEPESSLAALTRSAEAAPADDERDSPALDRVAAIALGRDAVEASVPAAVPEVTEVIPPAPPFVTMEGLVLGLDGEPRSSVEVRWSDPARLRWLDENRAVVVGPETFVPIDSTTRDAFARGTRDPLGFARREFRRPDLAEAFLRGANPPVYRTRTDSLGRFSIEVPEYGRSFRLEDEHEEILGCGNTKTSDGELVMTSFVGKRGVCRGRVVNQEGRGVEGATVRVNSEYAVGLNSLLAMGYGIESRQFRTTSGPNGEFVCHFVDRGEACRAQASTETELSDAIRFDPALREQADGQPLELVLQPRPDRTPKLTLTGRILLDDGSPAPRAVVVLNGVHTQTDLEGEYRLELIEVAGDLHAGRAGCGVATLSEAEFAGAAGTLRVRDLLLPRRSLAVEGRVVDSSGKPVRGAVVRLKKGISLDGETRSLEDVAAGRGVNPVRTDEHGRFRIDGLRDDDYDLRIEFDGRVQFSRNRRAGARDVVVTLL